MYVCASSEFWDLILPTVNSFIVVNFQRVPTVAVIIFFLKIKICDSDLDPLTLRGLESPGAFNIVIIVVGVVW